MNNTPFLQTGTCLQPPCTGQQHTVPSKCVVCQALEEGGAEGAGGVEGQERPQDDADADACRFQGLRLLRVLTSDALQVAGLKTVVGQNPSFVYPNQFRPKVSVAGAAAMEYDVALALKSVLNEEATILDEPNLLTRLLDAEHLIRCDECSQAILFSSFICALCGIEFCILCTQAHTDQHDASSTDDDSPCWHVWYPCVRESPNVIRQVLTRLDQTLLYTRSDGAPTAPSANDDIRKSKTRGTIARLKPTQDLRFQCLWHSGESLVVTLDNDIAGVWDPHRLSRVYGLQEIEAYHVSKLGVQTITNTTVQLFFDVFMNPPSDGSSLKIKDWPTAATFQSVWTEESTSFNESLPFPHYTGPRGFFNLPAHYARDLTNVAAHKPDLGPKLYVATGDPQGHGTTPLHLDVTSAVNILVYEHHLPAVGAVSGAEWVIFRRDQSERLRKYLNARYPDIEGDPIHSHEVFLKETDFVKLAKVGLYPHRFIQHQGQAVFINAGCAHQVRNLGPCIKVAIDFLDGSALPTTLGLVKEIRELRIPDVLMHKHILWHAHHSLREQWRDETNSAIKSHTRQQHINAKSRQSEIGKNRHSLHREQRAINTARYTKEEYKARFVVRCPDGQCEALTREFGLPGIFSHLRQKHHANLTKDDEDALTKTPYEDWPSKYHDICVRTKPEGTSSKKR